VYVSVAHCINVGTTGWGVRVRLSCLLFGPGTGHLGDWTEEDRQLVPVLVVDEGFAPDLPWVGSASCHLTTTVLSLKFVSCVGVYEKVVYAGPI